MSLLKPAKLIKRAYRKWKRSRYLHTVFIPTYRCNYRCPYCSVWQLDGKFPEVSFERWIDFWNAQPRTIIDITGGEPFFYQNFTQLIKGLNKKHEVAVTTNLSYSIDVFAEIWSRFSGVTVSFHPHTISLDKFFAKLEELKQYQRSISCNIVAYPDQLVELPKYINAFQNIGVRVNIDPYIAEGYKYSEDEIKLLRFARSLAMVKSPRKEGFQEQDKGVLKSCNAGQRHFLLLPNGDTYTCMCGYFQRPDEHYMGNVFDKSWSRMKKDIFCISSCSCGCDLDWVKISVNDRKDR